MKLKSATNVISEDQPIDSKPWRNNGLADIESMAGSVLNAVFGDAAINGQSNVQKLNELLKRNAPTYTIDPVSDSMWGSFIQLCNDFDILSSIHHSRVIPFVYDLNKNLYILSEFNNRNNPLWRKWYKPFQNYQRNE